MPGEVQRHERELVAAMHVVLRALVLAHGTAAEHTPDVSHGHVGDLASLRASLDVCLAIIALAEGDELEQHPRWRRLAADVERWSKRYAGTRRAWWWSPQACASRVDRLLEVAGEMEALRISDVQEWRALAVEDLSFPEHPPGQETDYTP